MKKPKKVVKSKRLEKKVKNLVEELEKTTYSEEDLKKIEEFHKRISYISPEDLLKSFTI